MHLERIHQQSHKIYTTQDLMWFTQLWATSTMVGFFIIIFLSDSGLRTVITKMFHCIFLFYYPIYFGVQGSLSASSLTFRHDSSLTY
jgi:hypothetical protein